MSMFDDVLAREERRMFDDVLAEEERRMAMGAGMSGATPRSQGVAYQPVAARTPDGRSVAPGTTPEQAQNVPPGMVYDPRTGGYIDTAAMAERRLAEPGGGAMGFSLNAMAGTPFVGEYADETMGRVGGRIAGMPAEAGQEYMRQGTQQYAEQNPGAALGARVVGGVTGAAAMMGAAPGAAAAIASRMPAAAIPQGLAATAGAAGAGALEGAVSGYGAGRSGAEGADSRPARAAEYGTYGALGGAVAGPVGTAANKAARGIGNVLANNWRQVSARIPGLSDEASMLLREAGGADAAAGNVAANIRRAGPNAMPADAGPATADLLDQSIAMSKSGTAVATPRVNARVAQAGRNLNATFDEVMGAARGMQELDDAIRAATRPGMKEAYQQAYQTPIDYASDAGRRVESVYANIPDRYKREALTLAREMMEIDGVPPQMLLQVDEAGNVVASRMPGVAELDYVKQALDQVAGDNYRQGNQRLGRIASIHAQRLRDAVDEAVPAYGEARQRASDAYSLHNALELGGRMLRPSTTREEVRAWAESATQLEKDAAAAGLRANIDETLANVRRTLGNPDTDAAEAKRALRDLSSRAARQKIMAVFGPERSRQIFRALDEAGAAAELAGNVARNSRTAPRQAFAQRLSEAREYSPGQMGRDFMSGQLRQSGGKMLSRAAGNTPADMARRDEQLYLELAEYLTGARGEEAIAAARAMTAAAQRDPAIAESLGQIGARVGIGTGLTAGQATTQSPRTGPR